MANTAADLMAALRFVRAAREDAAITSALAALDPFDGLDPVVAVATAAGFAISVESLRAAHAHDWALRRARYALDGATLDRAASTVAVVNTASLSR